MVEHVAQIEVFAVEPLHVERGERPVRRGIGDSVGIQALEVILLAHKKIARQEGLIFQMRPQRLFVEHGHSRSPLSVERKLFYIILKSSKRSSLRFFRRSARNARQNAAVNTAAQTAADFGSVSEAYGSAAIVLAIRMQ